MRRQRHLILAAFITMVMVLFTSNVYAGARNYQSKQTTIDIHQMTPHVDPLTRNKPDVAENIQPLTRLILNIHDLIHKPRDFQTESIHHAMYTVEPGDTLWSIARKFQSTIMEIRQLNHLSSALLLPGQTLQIRVVHNAYLDAVIHTHAGLLAGAPEFLIPVYQSAGKKYGIPWTVLAAIHREETDFSVSGNLVSCAGAQGPMQFMPATFAAFAVVAPGQSGAPNICNVYDAIYTTAHMLAVIGYCKSPVRAIYAYNHSMDYVQQILHLSSL